MSNISKSKKIKNISMSLLFIFMCCSISTFIAVFFNKNYEIESEEIEDSSTNNDEKDFKSIDISKEFATNYKTKEMIDFSYIDNDFIFKKELIDSVFFNILTTSLEKNSSFNDNANDYTKNAKYQISDNRKQLIINIFLFNKKNKSKKYKSCFKLIIK